MAAARAAVGLLGLCGLAHAVGDTNKAGKSSAALAAGSARAGPHPFPMRGVDEIRSGFSRFTAPFPLPSKPSWVYEVPGVNRHQTSALDSNFNLYSGSDAGVVQSFDKIGRQRWLMQAGSSSAQNPGLYGDFVYTAVSDGFAVAFHKDTGKEAWRTRISPAQPGDTYSPTAIEDAVIYPAGAVPPYGSPEVVCLNRINGTIRWRYSVGDKYGGVTGEIAKNGVGPKYTTVNLAPCIWNGSVIFNDVSGAMYSLSLADGKENWYTPGDDKDMYTLGGSCCGPNGKGYLGFSSAPVSGALETFDLKTGKKLWRTSFADEVHMAPAVGIIKGVFTAVVAVGRPTGLPPDPGELFLMTIGMLHFNTTGWVVASDAETGKVIWTFQPPPWHWKTCAGSWWDQQCLPDLWSGPTIDAAGTVWINWSAGGVLYGLRDANGDGTVDVHDPAETTSFDCGSAATGPPAVADGMVVTTTCRRIVAFSI